MGLTLSSSNRRRNAERWAWASLVANCGIILTGGLVRLTGSGLGCETWPKCTPESFTPRGAASYHQFIEFGNRMLTFVLVAVAVGTFLAIWRWPQASRRQKLLALVLALGIPLQAVVGGISVLAGLNPYIVAGHFLLSATLVIFATWLLIEIREPARYRLEPLEYWLTRAAFAALVVAVYLGTVVTGSGPYAGDADSPRNGLDPEMISRIHALSVWVLVAITVALIVRLRRETVVLSVIAVLIAELVQGLVGYVQYFTDLPIALVALHLVGSGVALAVATRLVLLTRRGWAD